MAENFDAGLTATYRLQFNKDFTFAQGAEIAPYLRDLGISHVYASPIMKAEPGSTHGYDVADFDRVNPELGGEPGFRNLARALQACGLGLVIDIVPNHMAVGGKDNPYWLDLLEKGRDSAYADFFDVDFDQPGLEGKILVPMLGGSYRETLEAGELVLKPRHDGDGFAVYYGDHCFPVRDVDRQTIRAEGVEAMNAVDKLHALLEAQHYRLANWRTANDLINYRRFFEITTLAGVRIERPEAFDRVHRLPLQFFAEGLIDGVRVDHVDGLTDPNGYCRRLREALDARSSERPEGRRRSAYIVVEKILAGDEPLPPWPVDGSTGYDFMDEVSALQHRASGVETLRRYFAELNPRAAEFEDVECAARIELLDRNFARQLESVVGLALRWGRDTSGDRDVTMGQIRRAVTAVIKHLRVYRSYALGGSDNPGAGPHLERAFMAARAEASRDDQALQILSDLMNARSESATAAEAIRRFNQLTAPVAAKAVEDTSFYRNGPLLSRNDVGFDAARAGLSTDAFHRLMEARAADWPHSMLTTATHDHKRGEDVRARLAVLSEIPERWIAECRTCRALNTQLCGGRLEAGEEYMLFQTLVGAWPPGLSPNNRAGLAEFADRIAGWLQKALREAKLRSSWVTPNEGSEQAAEAYARALLDPDVSVTFLHAVFRLVDDIAAAGMANGLTQAAMRCLAPGVPDLYRGAELWDFTLVDPDNRRPVDFALRERLLADPPSGDEGRKTGAIKQTLIGRLLSLRRSEPSLFAFGDYRPVPVDAPCDVLAFERRHEGKSVFAALSLRAGAALAGGARLTPPPEAWGDARLPFDLTGWSAVVGGAEGARDLPLARVLADLPVAVWINGQR